MGKMIARGFLVIIGCVVAYFLFRMFGAYSQGYSLEEMDWNEDGTTSVAEYISSSDIGKRDVTKAGVQCVEYFSYKDGLTMKIVCKKARRLG